MKRTLLSIAFFCSLINVQAQQSKAGLIDSAKAAWKEIAPFFAVPEAYQNQFVAYRSPLKFYDGRPVRTAKDWQARRAEILSQWHKMMGEWPPLLKDQRMKFLDTAKKEGYTQFRIKFKWLPNEETEGYLLVPDG